MCVENAVPDELSVASYFYTAGYTQSEFLPDEEESCEKRISPRGSGQKKETLLDSNRGGYRGNNISNGRKIAMLKYPANHYFAIFLCGSR